MKVFLSWSGDRSKQVAELLDEWMQCVIQAVAPWMSSKDIDRGALWFTEISDQLANTNVGIICLTKENKNKPWILFESGALAKGLSSNRICTFLIDLNPTDLENPLAQFNHTFPIRESMWELIRTINLTLKEKALKETILSKAFDTYWSYFEEKFKNILLTTPELEVTPKRKDNDIMLEVLTTVRNLDKRMRIIELNSENITAPPLTSKFNDLYNFKNNKTLIHEAFKILKQNNENNLEIEACSKFKDIINTEEKE